MNENTIIELSPETNERISKAPNPSKATLKARQNLFMQIFHFIGFNFRILQLVTISKFRK